MYITGEADLISSLLGDDQRNAANAALTQVCRLNPHLDQSTIQRKGTMPPYTPLIFPDTYTTDLAKKQGEVMKATRSPVQKRQMMHYVQQNPMAFDGAITILDDLNAHNRDFVHSWKNPLEMPKIAAPLSIVDELSKQGTERLEGARSYRVSKKFIEELAIKDGLAAKYNFLKGEKGKSHPETRAAYKAYVSQRNSIREEFPRVLDMLNKRDRKMITSPTKGYKIADNGGTNRRLNIDSKIGRPVDTKVFGQKIVSYEAMEKMLAGAKVVNRSLFVLGAVGAGIDSYVAYEKGLDPIRPIAKFGSGLAGAVAGGELGIAATGAIATMSGVSAEAVMVFLACTPWGWVALGVIAGVGGYYGSQYGEEGGLKIYDEGKKLLKGAEKTIAESWDAICEHAASLYSSIKFW